MRHTLRSVLHSWCYQCLKSGPGISRFLASYLRMQWKPKRCKVAKKVYLKQRYRAEHCKRAVGCIHEDTQRPNYSFGSLFMRLMKKKSLVTRSMHSLGGSLFWMTGLDYLDFCLCPSSNASSFNNMHSLSSYDLHGHQVHN